MVELHREGSASAACASGLFLITPSPYPPLKANNTRLVKEATQNRAEIKEVRENASSWLLPLTPMFAYLGPTCSVRCDVLMFYPGHADSKTNDLLKLGPILMQVPCPPPLN